jgi:hypothetical protein
VNAICRIILERDCQRVSKGEENLTNLEAVPDRRLKLRAHQLTIEHTISAAVSARTAITIMTMRLPSLAKNLSLDCWTHSAAVASVLTVGLIAIYQVTTATGTGPKKPRGRPRASSTRYDLIWIGTALPRQLNRP